MKQSNNDKQSAISAAISGIPGQRQQGLNRLLLWLLFPALLATTQLQAAEPDVRNVRKIVISTEGDVDQTEIMKMMEQVEADLAGSPDKHINVFVTADEAGNVNVEHLPVPPVPPHDGAAIMGVSGVTQLHRAWPHQPRQPDLSAEAGACVIKHLSKANTDAAARLLRAACAAMYPLAS
ncbi:MAG: hypothetical protein KDI36_02495 [Pseudomonadales bacterium]|nr:hypothetical protein [Pseudomonadales bacterium]